jgi:hypothetical protein
MIQCSRKVCQVELEDITHTAIHKHTKLPYCIRCARMINRDCGEAVVTWGASNENSDPDDCR